MKNAIPTSKFVVQIAHLLEVDHGGAPNFSPPQILAVAGSIDEARSLAQRFPIGPTADVQILEVFQPVDVGGGSLRFLAPIRRAVVDPKPLLKKPASRRAKRAA